VPVSAGSSPTRSAKRRLQCAGMDIEAFYDADPRRRSSVEVEFGQDWRDAHGVRYELSWIEDTGELYVMREPVPSGWATPFGGVHVYGAHSADEKELEAMSVAVIAVVPTREEVEKLLDGWQQAIESPDSVAWIVRRLRERGVLSSDVSFTA
jgi:hypothetical protein